jgi:hypothetical protein
MFWLQGLVSFALWIGYGIMQSRRSPAIKAKLVSMPRHKRALNGALLMVGGGAVLFAVLLAVYALGGFTRVGMSLWAWFAISAAGLLFVHGQTMSMAMLVTLIVEPGVTSIGSGSSDQKGTGSAQM